jgi:hypothetical protein
LEKSLKFIKGKNDVQIKDPGDFKKQAKMKAIEWKRNNIFWTSLDQIEYNKGDIIPDKRLREERDNEFKIPTMRKWPFNN